MGTWQGGYIYRNSPELVTLNAAILAKRPAAPERRYARGEAPHGTRAAHRRHERHGEPPCQACREAVARARADKQARQREYRLARRRAAS